nr:MAG TPA: hypothetical protein [Bacteriophage sp.]
MLGNFRKLFKKNFRFYSTRTINEHMFADGYIISN